VNVSELAYKPKRGGRADGVMMLHVSVGGPSGSLMDVMQVVERCEQAAGIMRMKARNILVTPDVDGDDKEITKLLMLLKDRQFVISLILDGFHIPIYLREASFIQAVLHGPDWNNFMVSEVVYMPEGKELVEPVFMGANQQCGKHVYLSPKLKTKVVLDFIRNSNYLWGIIIPPTKDISVDFLGGVEQ